MTRCACELPANQRTSLGREQPRPTSNPSQNSQKRMWRSPDNRFAQTADCGCNLSGEPHGPGNRVLPHLDAIAVPIDARHEAQRGGRPPRQERAQGLRKEETGESGTSSAAPAAVAISAGESQLGSQERAW